MTLELLRREFPDVADYWGGNWFVARVSAVAPGFQADFLATVHQQEIVSLQEAVAQLAAALEGRVEWKTVEGFLDFHAARNRLGHIRWTLDLIRPVGTGNRLTLQLDNDQTYLPELLHQIDNSLEAFSLLGSPVVKGKAI